MQFTHKPYAINHNVMLTEADTTCLSGVKLYWRSLWNSTTELMQVASGTKVQ